MYKGVSSGPFPSGINSLLDPVLLQDSEVQMSYNAMNRGGCYQTRPGLHKLPDLPSYQGGLARGMTIFTPLNQDPFLVAGVGPNIYVSKYPFLTWTALPLKTNQGDDALSFEVGIKGAKTNPDGSLTVIPPYPVLIIQYGNGKPIMWDGIKNLYLDPAQNQTPVGQYMKWIGGRLFVMNENRVRASNILDPLTFTEEDLIAEGGFFVLPDKGTGFGATADLRSLIAFTNSTATSFQPTLARNLWSSTAGFQQVILPDIGCVAPNTIQSQYGVLWWLSEGGLMRLDNALQAYRSSKVRYEDLNMSRVKANISHATRDRSCAGAFENLLLLSVPSGDAYNSQTWIMDQSVSDQGEPGTAPAWSTVMTGIRPVQWVKANIRGQPRIFCMSRDYPPTGSAFSYQVGIWEAFTGARQDVAKDLNGVTRAKSIQSSVETKFMGYAPDNDGNVPIKEFHHAKLEITELSETVQLDVFYATRHSGYKNIFSQQIVATTANISLDDPMVIDVPYPSWVRQTRTVATNNDSLQSTEVNQGVERPWTGNKDSSFALLMKWTGQMSLGRVTIFYTPDTDDQSEGNISDTEITERYVTSDGKDIITSDSPVYGLPVNLTGQAIKSTSSRWTEDFYQSIT